MKHRVVVPELLDHLPHDGPAARRSRIDLRRINFLMGNERWLIRSLKRLDGAVASTLCEIGAGDGGLVSKVCRCFPKCRVIACDLAPRPAGLDEAVEWLAGDVFKHPPAAGGVLLANLFLHHFEGHEMKRLGELCADHQVLLFNEPDRSHIASMLGMLLHPFVNHVTRHDMQVSIRAGFRRGEMAALLGLDEKVWKIRETSTWRGARRVIAWRT
jgi:hypothetical protein